jgi:hypothetical protein
VTSFLNAPRKNEREEILVVVGLETIVPGARLVLKPLISYSLTLLQKNNAETKLKCFTENTLSGNRKIWL